MSQMSCRKIIHHCIVHKTEASFSKKMFVYNLKKISQVQRRISLRQKPRWAWKALWRRDTDTISRSNTIHCWHVRISFKIDDYLVKSNVITQKRRDFRGAGRWYPFKTPCLSRRRGICDQNQQHGWKEHIFLHYTISYPTLSMLYGAHNTVLKYFLKKDTENLQPIEKDWIPVQLFRKNPCIISRIVKPPSGAII